jgi:hypothetical protein
MSSLFTGFSTRTVWSESEIWPILTPSWSLWSHVRFPPGGDLQKGVPVPLFLQNTTHAIAVHSAVGDTRLIQTVEENSKLLDSTSLTSIGVILDADSVRSPAERYVEIRDGLRGMGYALPEDAGTVAAGPPRLGVFVLPDNLTNGTLEDVLLECAQHAYSTLLTTATTHVDAAFGDGSLSADDTRELRKPAGRNKAIVSSIASILRPGRAVQVSIQDNRWLRDTALGLPRVKAVQDFLVNLLELP